MGRHRSTLWRKPRRLNDVGALTAVVIELVRKYVCYGCRRVTVLLRGEGLQVNHKRVARIWRREGPRVLEQQPKRGCLWLNDGTYMRLRPEHPNYLWAHDFVQDRTEDGRTFLRLTVIDRVTRECLAIEAVRPRNDQCSIRSSSMLA